MINLHALGITKAKAADILKGKYQIIIKDEWIPVFKALPKESLNTLWDMILSFNKTLEYPSTTDDMASITFLSFYPYLEQSMIQYLKQSKSQSDKAQKRYQGSDPDG